MSRTVAVKVTGEPTIDGFADDRSTTAEDRVPLAMILTETVSVLEPKLPSPW